MRKTTIKIAIILTLTFIIFSCNNSNKDNNKSSETTESFDDIIKNKDLVIVDFYADWCKPCKIQAPIIDELGQEFGDKLEVIKINVDNEAELTQRFNIQSIPTIIIFKKGNIVWQNVGVQEKSKLSSIIKQNM